MIEYSQLDDVAVLTIDDGKANAVGNAFIDAMNEGLDRAEQEAKAVLIVGRTGVFSGGFDLKEFQKGPEATTALVTRGAHLLLRVYSYPLPIVAACTGHAVAAGAFLLLAVDTRIGASGAFRIGLNETAIGMTLPVFGLELAKARLSKRHQTTAVVQAHLFDPEGAKDAGFLDAITAPDAVVDAALAQAQALAKLPGAAYSGNKLAIRADTIATIRASS